MPRVAPASIPPPPLVDRAYEDGKTDRFGGLFSAVWVTSQMIPAPPKSPTLIDGALRHRRRLLATAQVEPYKPWGRDRALLERREG